MTERRAEIAKPMDDNGWSDSVSRNASIRRPFYALPFVLAFLVV